MSLVDPVDFTAEVTPETESQETQDQNAQVETQIDDSIPEKFRGKSLKDVISAYQNLESETGRHRNEVGTLRRLNDELLDLRRGPAVKSTPVAKPVTPYDLAERPEETITEVAKRVADERTSGAEERLAVLEHELKAERFQKKYPAFQSTITSPEFAQWVQKSQLRTSLAIQASRNDWNAADELLTLYSESTSASQAQSDSQDAVKEGAKQQGLAKSGGSGANKVVNGSDGKKTYKRSELSELYVRNPEEYNRRYQEEFHQAYLDGRVK